MGQALSGVNGGTVVFPAAFARAENGPDEGQDMFVEECRRAVQASPRSGLDALAREVWRAYGADQLTADEASELCEAIAARRVVPSLPGNPAMTPLRRGARPRTPASLERRRSWAAGSWMPPAMAAGFTQAENAALAVIIREIATAGRCGLPVGAIAARAGVCTTIVKRAVREARRRGILHVEERRVSYTRNLPNLITIVSRELALWVRTRARVEGPFRGNTPTRGGGTSVSAPTNHTFHSHARPIDAVTEEVRREEGKRHTKALDRLRLGTNGGRA